VYTEASSVLRAVVADFFFNYVGLKNAVLWDGFTAVKITNVFSNIGKTSFGMYQGASPTMGKDFDWKLSNISMFDVEAVSPEL
jgi:hypothetical protein